MRRIATTMIVLAALAAPAFLGGQTPGAEGRLASQSLRPYGHVFLAYALAWALVLGWVISLARRWARLEDELGGGGDG